VDRESQGPDESSKARARKSRVIGLQATGQHRGGRRSGAVVQWCSGAVVHGGDIFRLAIDVVFCVVTVLIAAVAQCTRAARRERESWRAVGGHWWYIVVHTRSVYVVWWMDPGFALSPLA
jgi:hypothetical protein